MYERERAIKILLPDGQLLALLGNEVRFEPFDPEAVRPQIPPAEAEAIALVCLNKEGQEVGRIKMSAILGYLTE